MSSRGLDENSGCKAAAIPMTCPIGDAVNDAVGFTAGGGDLSPSRKVAHVRWSARYVRWVWMTPFGAAVVPDV